jgi:Rieske 2Fe-2S family protein
MTTREVHHTLPGSDYSSPGVFAVERERIFFRHWYYLGRDEGLAEPGDFRVADVCGESILLVRDREGELRAFYNVCRHRGSRLCDASAGRLKGAIKCPYHAWSYGLDGRLIGTPNVRPDEVDRATLGLTPVAVRVWEGFLFVNLADDPPPLEQAFGAADEPPLSFARFAPGGLRVGRRTVVDVRANWKVLIENYHECLHCPTVHPELVQLLPAYRHGSVIERGRADGGVGLAEGATGFTATGTSSLPVLPGLEGAAATAYFGCSIFPNAFLDLQVNTLVATALHPTAADATTVVAEYLFAPDAIADPAFDPSDVVDFTELVARQDYDVCERVQVGVSSRAYRHGVYAEKDDALHAFNQRYLASRGPLP